MQIPTATGYSIMLSAEHLLNLGHSHRPTGIRTVAIETHNSTCMCRHSFRNCSKGVEEGLDLKNNTTTSSLKGDKNKSREASVSTLNYDMNNSL